MKVLLAVVAWILAINVAYAAWLAISEFIGARRARREAGTLPAMWQLPDLPRRGSRRPSRALVGGLAVVIVGGVALASPARERVVETVGDVIGDLRGDTGTGERAAHEEGASPTDATSTLEPSPSTTPADDPRERFSGDRDAADAAASAPVTGPAVSPGQASPPDEQAPPPTSSPTAAAPSTEPSPTQPADLTFWSSAEAVSATEIRVEWERVPSATSYEVHRSDGAGASVLVVEVPAGKREVTVQRLSPGTVYDFTLTAESPGGVLATSVVSATTPPVAES